MAKTTRPGTVPGFSVPRKGRPRVLKEPVSFRVDVEREMRDEAAARMHAMGHDSISELIRAAVQAYLRGAA